MVGLAIILLVPLLITLLSPLFQRLGASAGANEGAKRTKAVELMMDSTESRYFQFISEDPEKREVWFKFKPTADGDYKFDFESIDSEANYEIILYKGNDELSRYNTEDIKSVELEKGKKYYVVVSFTGESRDDNFSGRVSGADPKGAYRDDAYELVAGYNEGQTYASLTATYGNKDDGGKYGASPSIDGYGENYKFSHVFFKFTPTETTRYTFKPDVSEAYIRLYDSIDGSSVSYQNYMGGDGLEYALVAGTTYYYQVEFDGYSRQTSFAVTLKAEPKGLSEESAYVIQLGDNAGPAGGYESIQEEDYVWFKFTPAVDGKYKFTVDNSVFGSNYVSFNLYERDNTWNDTSSSSKSSSMSNWHSLYTNYDYYVKISCDYFNMDPDFTIKVEAAKGTSYDNAIELSLEDASELIYNDDLYSNIMYFKYTPTVAGFYSFNYANISYSSSYLYKADNTSTYIEYSYSDLASELEANTTYYVKLNISSNSNNDDLTVTVTELVAGATREAAIELEFGETAERAWDVIADGSSYIWFKFKPTTTDYYTLKPVASDATFGSMYVYQGTNTYTVSEASYGYGYDMYNGSFYYIQLYVSYGDTFGFSITESAQGTSRADAIEIGNTAKSVAYNYSTNTGGEVWFKYTPATSGTHTLNITNVYCLNNSSSSYKNRTVYVYTSLTGSAASSYSGSGTGQSITLNLNSDLTYYFCVDFTSNTSYSRTFNIQIV